MSETSDVCDMLAEMAVTTADALVAAGVPEGQRGFVWRRLVLFLRTTGLWPTADELADDLHETAEADAVAAAVLWPRPGPGTATQGGGSGG